MKNSSSLSHVCLFDCFYITLFSTIFKCQSPWPVFQGSPVLAALPHKQLTASSHEWSVTCVNRSFFPILEAFLYESRSVSQCHQWNLENSPQAKKINLVFRATVLKTLGRAGAFLLAHLSTKCSGWAIVTGLCPSSVVVRRPSCVVRRPSCVNFFT